MSAFFDLKTNEIWAMSNITDFHKNHVEIDEVIAPIIQELNRKGYKTRFCCSGHPFVSLCEIFVSDEASANAFANPVSAEKQECLENPEFPYRVLCEESDVDFYILFEEPLKEIVSIPLPAGFLWAEPQTIRYNYSKYFYAVEETYEFLSERLSASMALYLWAKGLPPMQKG